MARSKDNPSKPLSPESIKPAAPWVIGVGAMFGGITLIGLFVIAFLAGSNDSFVCNSFQLLGAIFALGASLSAAFLGGGAAAHGKIGTASPVAFGVSGGIAVLIIVFVVFSNFKPECRAAPVRTGDIEAIRKHVETAFASLNGLDPQLQTAIERSKAAQVAGVSLADCSMRSGQAEEAITEVRRQFATIRGNVETATKFLDQLPRPNE